MDLKNILNVLHKHQVLESTLMHILLHVIQMYYFRCLTGNKLFSFPNSKEFANFFFFAKKTKKKTNKQKKLKQNASTDTNRLFLYQFYLFLSLVCLIQNFHTSPSTGNKKKKELKQTSKPTKITEENKLLRLFL